MDAPPPAAQVDALQAAGRVAYKTGAERRGTRAAETAAEPRPGPRCRSARPAPLPLRRPRRMLRKAAGRVAYKTGAKRRGYASGRERRGAPPRPTMPIRTPRPTPPPTAQAD